MDEFQFHEGRLFCEQIPAADLAARFGTPLYVYSQATFVAHYERIVAAFAPVEPLICYSIKSCPNVHLCRLLAERGSGFDVVSGGELYRALQAGADPRKIVFAGVGKTDAEVVEALRAGIGLFNIESRSELGVMEELLAQLDRRAEGALRVNPDVDAGTHHYTTTGRKETKFGVDIDQAVEVFEQHRGARRLRLCGIHLHIGSPVFDVAAYARGIERGVALIDDLRRRGFELDTIDIGGGFGAHYRGAESPPAAEYAAAVLPALRSRGLRVILEPGRAIAGNAGIILTRVVHVKQSGTKRFVIVDASMNELIRPALYDAYHFVWPVEAGVLTPPHRRPEQPFDGLQPADVVGPVCESGDFLARARLLPEVRRGDLLAVFTAGAYAMSMASQYNSRPRAAEVLVDRADARLIRRRETYSDLVAAERV
ncbi:MAG: Diaminopimelate decarboxylase [Phycisphaerae bacterium]|nr:Diaminopimelate decarboxylase [Phycisphaerae bacterium]